MLEFSCDLIFIFWFVNKLCEPIYCSSNSLPQRREGAVALRRIGLAEGASCFPLGLVYDLNYSPSGAHWADC